MPQQESFETPCGGLQIPEDIFTSAAQVTAGLICNRGHIDGGEIACAPQPGELDGIPTVGFHAVPGLFGNSGGGDDPAHVSFVGQVAREPIAAGAGFVDQDEMCALGLECDG